ncbi:MAG TPA: hypothetical protein VHL53_00330, partial [Acidimicrobiia bacterium]|nr:hypothetical protein [Acidimicrobiia bacterium]
AAPVVAPASPFPARPVAVAPPAEPALPVEARPVTRRCETTSRGWLSGCSRGAPLPASAAALGLAAVFFGADWWRSRPKGATA